jgi:hypothetical protein
LIAATPLRARNCSAGHGDDSTIAVDSRRVRPGRWNPCCDPFVGEIVGSCGGPVIIGADRRWFAGGLPVPGLERRGNKAKRATVRQDDLQDMRSERLGIIRLVQSGTDVA